MSATSAKPMTARARSRTARRMYCSIADWTDEMSVLCYTETGGDDKKNYMPVLVHDWTPAAKAALVERLAGAIRERTFKKPFQGTVGWQELARAVMRELPR